MKKAIYFIFTKSVGLYLNSLSFVFPKKANDLAYTLFSKPRKGQLTPDKLPATLSSATINTFKNEGQEFATYTWKGNDTIILLIHGWESNSSRWKKMLPYLKATGSTIIALDGPAHGLSSGEEFTIPKYASAIDVLVTRYRPKYLIGHSFGGKTCLYYQSHYKNTSIEKVVSLGAPNEFNIILNNYINLLSLNKKIVTGLHEKCSTVSKINLQQFTGKDFASQLNTKGLIAHDINDKIVNFKEGKAIAAAWKDVVFIETTGLGHGLHDDTLYNQIIAFLFDTEK
ncbi:alpha/beta fold hydrolase [Flavobacterium sp. 7A]|uniref:alpha/beta fold hydrolase n=1 Tax=Flavobacterium sp. 7A TaxID=2940571 RepID=UPI002226D62F|nr:alpha/beta hydrolase [Flavobacterium sp. 7A]MCW2120166.1 pimeloyl-ACP methyl ester carboxylesterase [Flavobacterium sp. 7A]